MTRTWTRIPKEPHGSEAWLAQRWALPTGERLISASVAGAIYDRHPFTSPADLAAELLADTPPMPKQQNAAMERGNRLEPVLIEWANDTLGRKFVTPDELFVFTDGPARMIATLDGFDGSKILEIKTTTTSWTGVLPEYWRMQGVHQAVCANVDTVHWAVFDNTQTLNFFEQYVSSDEKELHIQAVGKWLTNIDLGITPDGVEWTYGSISARFKDAVDEVVEVGPRAVELAAELKHAKSELKSYEEIVDRKQAELCELIGNATTAVANGDVIATWKPQSRKSLDQKALREAHPELFEQFTKESSWRVLRLKGNK